MTQPTIQIREIKGEEEHILGDFLYKAIYQLPDVPPLPREIIYQPELRIYIDDFGKPDDYCFVADDNNKIVGAVWSRIFSEKVKGYGYVDDKTPELVISLMKEYRSKGIGTMLVTHMIAYLKKRGYRKVSLSVVKNNYACKLYQKIGFRIVKERRDDYKMILWLDRLDNND